MDTLREELDRCFGDGPPPVPVDVHLSVGRRALRRRRVGVGASVVTAAAVLVTGWYAVAPGALTRSGDVAGDPGPSTTPSTSVATDDPTATAWPRGELIRYVDGELEIRPGVVVHEHIRNPHSYEPPALSDALDVTWQGARQWLVIERTPGSGISTSASTPSNGWASFGDYVASQVDLNAGSGWPETFVLDEQGRVVPAPGVVVHNRTDDPDLGPTFASPGETTGAAVVSVPGEEGNYFVVWRVVDGTIDVITTPPDDIVGATFEQLLTGAREAYAMGEGLR